MAETLYRKYRPQIFAEVAEQAHVVRTITNQLSQGKMAQAYLFNGPRGVGKTTIARLLAKALNCQGRQPGQFEPCNQCISCNEMKEGRMLDVVEIDAASQTRVEETRENIIENVRFSPTSSKFKVFIIDEVHMLSTASFNALLKTLEEPPAHAVFILATTELHKIPATIISRCQRFDFHRIPAAEMMVRLTKIAESEGRTVEAQVLAQIARLSEGCLRDAESLLGQLLTISDAHITSEQAALILPVTHTETVANIALALGEKNVQQALTYLNEAVDNGASVKNLADELIEYARTMLFVSLAHTAQPNYDGAALERLQKTASLFSVEQLKRWLDLLLTARFRSSLGSLPQIPLEIAIIEAGSSSVGSLVPVTQVSSAVPSEKTTPRLNSPAELPPSSLKTHEQSSANVQVTEPAKPVLANINTDLPFTLTDLQDKWGRCCALAAEKNVALPLVLKSSKPVSLEGRTLTISFAYQFHLKAIEEPKNNRLLSEAIAQVMLAAPAQIKCIVEEKTEEKDAVDTLLGAFGGAVV